MINLADSEERFTNSEERFTRAVHFFKKNNCKEVNITVIVPIANAFKGFASSEKKRLSYESDAQHFFSI